MVPALKVKLTELSGKDIVYDSARLPSEFTSNCPVVPNISMVRECCSPEGVVVVTCWLSVTTGVVVVVVGVTVTVIGAPGVVDVRAGSGGTLMDRARPAELSELSVTRMVKLKFPAASGVPVIVPAAWFRESRQAAHRNLPTRYKADCHWKH